MYTDTTRNVDAEPGLVPRLGGRFYNEDNPHYLPNGTDCYQRLTDDSESAGVADVTAIWHALRQRWIDWHTDPADVQATLRKIPGVDTSVFANGSSI